MQQKDSKIILISGIYKLGYIIGMTKDQDYIGLKLLIDESLLRELR